MFQELLPSVNGYFTKMLLFLANFGEGIEVKYLPPFTLHNGTHGVSMQLLCFFCKSKSNFALGKID